MEGATRIADQLIAAARDLCRQADSLHFALPVTHVYNPLGYASSPHETYIRSYANQKKRVIFWGMNPGPWGMAQTGVPFGEISAVSTWMGISGAVGRPPHLHPRRPIEGFSCTRSEVSGRRLWGLMQARFSTASGFFEEHFVANYCPLVFMEESGRNRTPDKLLADEREALFSVCDLHAARVISILEPEWVIGVGKFAEGRLRSVTGGLAPRGHTKVGGILHPSPASPRANRGWETAAVAELNALGVWR